MADEKGNTSDGGTMRSPEGSASRRGWTVEEMRGAEPMPMPMVDAVEGEIGEVPHLGPGKTSAGGRPDETGG